MELIIITILLCVSLFWNMKQYALIKKCGCLNEPKKARRRIKKGTSTKITSEDSSSDNQNGQDV